MNTRAYNTILIVLFIALTISVVTNAILLNNSTKDEMIITEDKQKIDSLIYQIAISKEQVKIHKQNIDSLIKESSNKTIIYETNIKNVMDVTTVTDDSIYTFIKSKISSN